MKKLFYIVISALLFAVACEQPAPEENPSQPQVDPTLVYSFDNFAGHEAVVVKPAEIASNAPVVVVLTDDLELKTRLSVEPSIDVNFKAAEHCLVGGYTLCVVGAADGDDIAFLNEVKAKFVDASKLYLLSYCNGLAYTAAMVMPEAFAAYGCVSGTIDVKTYKTHGFTKPVSFVHVHATKNSVFKWNGVANKSASVSLSVGAIVAINECLVFDTTELLQREGKGLVSCTHYTKSLSGCDVKLYTVESTSNGWCDEEFEVYNQVWNFFKTH